MRLVTDEIGSQMRLMIRLYNILSNSPWDCATGSAVGARHPDLRQISQSIRFSQLRNTRRGETNAPKSDQDYFLIIKQENWSGWVLHSCLLPLKIEYVERYLSENQGVTWKVTQEETRRRTRVRRKRIWSQLVVNQTYQTWVGTKDKPDIPNIS